MPAPKVLANRMSAGDRRHQLLEVALDVFSRKGFEGTTTKEIAKLAGVTEALIFRHFPNKQTLYSAVLDYKVESEETQSWLAETRALMDRNDDEGLLRAVASKIIESYRKDPRFERVILFAALEGHEQGLAHYRGLTAPISELLTTYIARRQSEGALRKCDPRAVVAAIAGMAQHYAMTTQMFCCSTADISDEQVVEAFVRIVMNGIQLPHKTKNRENL